MTARGRIVAVVLAGGQGSRMGGADKALLMLTGRPLLVHVLERLAPQVAAIALAGGPTGARQEARLAGFGRPVLADPLPDHAGPLSGLLAGMDWAEGLGADWLLSVSCDVPFLPVDLLARLTARAEVGDVDVVRAASLGRAHHVIALWSLALAPALREALLAREQRGVGRFAAAHRLAEVVWDEAVDPFANVNGPDDLAVAEARLADRQVR